MIRFVWILCAVALALMIGEISLADDAASGESLFQSKAAPFVQNLCVDCHSGDEAEAGLDLSKYEKSAFIQTDYEVWERVLRMLDERAMPPKEADQPTEQQREDAVAGIRAALATFDCQSQKHPGRVTIRRLNRAEYNNTIRDLIGVDFNPAKDFPADDVGDGFDNIADVLSLPPVLLEKYLAASETIVEKAMSDETARNRIIAYKPSSDLPLAEAARRNLEQFATRAFRRPATAAEVDRLMALIKALNEQHATKQGATKQEAFGAALQAILTSPHFLFRIEADPAPDDADGVRDLNDYEIAVRLSYFLWSTMPDETLFNLAANGELKRPDVLHAQVRRMLQDPKAKALTKNFASQWLQLRSLDEAIPAPDVFPQYNAELRSAMMRETELLFETVVRDDLSILTFLDADFTYINGTLAKHYDIEGVSGNEFQRVSLDNKRRGVLTHASILLLTSNPARTSPVKRGKWILDNILGEPPPDPPPGVAELDENAATIGSLREQLEQHRNNASCSVCHNKMDSLGFALENFDPIGAWRDRDGKHEINPAGQLPGGRSFKDAGELMTILAEHKKDAFSRCLTEKLLTYALGRGLTTTDRCAVNSIVKQVEDGDHRFSKLVHAIVTSDPFTKRESP